MQYTGSSFVSVGVQLVVNISYLSQWNLYMNSNSVIWRLTAGKSVAILQQGINLPQPKDYYVNSHRKKIAGKREIDDFHAN